MENFNAKNMDVFQVMSAEVEKLRKVTENLDASFSAAAKSVQDFACRKGQKFSQLLKIVDL